MKDLKIIISVFIVCGLMATSCSKNEQSAVEDTSVKKTKYQLSVPLKDGRSAIELDPALVIGTNRIAELPVVSPVQILNPDNKYIKSTTLIDISNLKNFDEFFSVQDQKIKLTFSYALLKMNGFPNGWTALWNVPPFVERESPAVLYSQQENYISIVLSKYCTTFGFELAPNLYNSYQFTTGFYDSDENTPVATVTRIATTPSGAQLFAVNSEKPFNVIEIQYSGTGGGGNQPYGFAITNLRYKLCTTKR